MTEQQLKELLSRNPYLKVAGSRTSPEVKEQHPKGTDKGRNTAVSEHFADVSKTLAFDSREEELFYREYILPRLLAGELREGERAESFVLLPKVKLQGGCFREIRYTPDFKLTDRNGKVTYVEIKGRQIRKWQRDYPLRKRLFVERYCVPNGWSFWEIRAEDVREGTL